MFEQALGLDKSFNFDASAQRPVQNFDVFAATKNFNNIAQNNDLRNTAEATRLAANEIAAFDRNSQEKTQFITGNNNFSINQIAGFERELSDVLRADRELLIGQANRAIDVVSDREKKDATDLLREQTLADTDAATLVNAKGLAVEAGVSDLSGSIDDILGRTAERNLEISNKKLEITDGTNIGSAEDLINSLDGDVTDGQKPTSIGSFTDEDGAEISNEENPNNQIQATLLQEDPVDLYLKSIKALRDAKDLALPGEDYDQLIADINNAAEAAGRPRLTDEEEYDINFG